MTADRYPRILPGKRAIIAGRTGSGKSTLGKWLLARSPGRWLILNPKWTSAYNSLPDSNVVKSLDIRKIEKSMMSHHFTIINPGKDEANAESMDYFIETMHDSYSNFGICADELYTLHRGNGTAGDGLIGLLTRGRELKQSFLGMTQRPAFISKFLFSESDYICGMSLALHDDRKRMYENTSRDEFLGQLPPHEWLWYDVTRANLRYFGAVPMGG